MIYDATLKHIERLRREANELLDAAIETEMTNVIAHKSIGTVLKCMGQVTLYNQRMEPIPKEDWPIFAMTLQKLADEDTEYYSLTGRPLKLFKKKGRGQEVFSTRDW